MIIYKATNMINGKIYIGQTVNSLEHRRKQHENSAKNGGKYAFDRALHKYGSDNFTWEVIKECHTIEELNEMESFFIDKYESLVDQNGYNLKGGGGNAFLTESVKEKIGKAQIGDKNHMFGRCGKDNPTAKPVMNITGNKKYDSITECADCENVSATHISAVCNGKRGSANGCVFRYIDAKTGEIVNPEKNSQIKNKPVMNIDTGEIYKTASEAERVYFGKKVGNINRVCKGERETCAGYRWKFI